MTSSWPPMTSTSTTPSHLAHRRRQAVQIIVMDEIDRQVAALDIAQFAQPILKGDALIVTSSPFGRTAPGAEAALRHRLPSIGTYRPYAEAGFLMSYGPNISDMFRIAADYVDKILKGAKPADLPVQQPTKFELVINLKTAKALGLTIPPAILARADEIIE